MRPPKESNGGIVLPPFQIDVGGTKEQPPPLGQTFTRRVNHNYKMHGQSPLLAGMSLGFTLMRVSIFKSWPI